MAENINLFPCVPRYNLDIEFFEGYVMSRYIRLFVVLLFLFLVVIPMHTQELTPDALADLINRQVATTTNRVNVRAEAAASGELLAELSSNTEVRVVAVVETDSTQYPVWYEIVLEDGSTGFAWSELFGELETIAPIVVDSPNSFSADWVVLDSMISGIDALVADNGEDVAKNLLLNYAEELLNGEILLVNGFVVNRAREIYNVETDVWEYDP